MRISEHEQGSPEWLQERIGLITASKVDKLITPTGKPSTSAKGYIDEIVSEMLMGRAEETFQSAAMLRGKELEPEARAWVELQQDYDVQQVGLGIIDDLRAGASPDGLIGDDGGLEIKCPTPKIHTSYLREGKMPDAYIPQVQMNIWLWSRDWWDFCSYHPEMPKLLVRVERDQKFIAAMVTEINKAKNAIESNYQYIRSRYS